MSDSTEPMHATLFHNYEARECLSAVHEELDTAADEIRLFDTHTLL